MGLTRRRVVAIGTGLSLPTIIRAHAQASGSISLAGPGGPFQEEFQAAILEPFRRLRPDVAVFYYATSNPGQILTLLRMRIEPPQFDVALLTPRLGVAATRQGLLEPLRPETMPILNELDPAARIENMAGVTAMLDCLSLARMPTAPPITAWRDLWDATRVDRLALQAAPDPIGLGVTMIAKRLFGQGEGPESLAGAITALGHLAPRVVSWHPRPNAYDIVIDEWARYAIGWNGVGQIRARRNPTRLAMSVPADIRVREAHTIHLVKGSARPEAGRALIGYLLGGEAQTRIVERLHLTPVHPGARIAEADRRRIPPPPDPAGTVIIDSDEVEASRPAIVAGWRETVLRARP
jgi:putative spermidine/putrescine transport system substrate-binding protein